MNDLVFPPVTRITLDKELCRDINAIIQRIRASNGRNSRERSLALTKLQEAVMWLEMDMKASNDQSNANIDPTALCESIFTTHPEKD